MADEYGVHHRSAPKWQMSFGLKVVLIVFAALAFEAVSGIELSNDWMLGALILFAVDHIEHRIATAIRTPSHD